MDAIASCIIGGASFAGGIGNVPGAFLGVIIFSVINYGLTFVGLSSYWQFIVKGLIIIVAVALDMASIPPKNRKCLEITEEAAAVPVGLFDADVPPCGDFARAVAGGGSPVSGHKGIGYSPPTMTMDTGV